MKSLICLRLMFASCLISCLSAIFSLSPYASLNSVYDLFMSARVLIAWSRCVVDVIGSVMML